MKNVGGRRLLTPTARARDHRMLQDDEITEAAQEQRERDWREVTQLLRRCGNTILKREFLKAEVGRMEAHRLSRITLWQHRFDDQSADVALLLDKALTKGHHLAAIDDSALALSKEAKTRHVAGQSLIDDAQAMLPAGYLIYSWRVGSHVAVVLSTVISCTVQ